MPDDAGVYSCDAAGRDGFWRHRGRMAHGLHHVVVDSARLDGTRRGRRTKTDRRDARKLRTLLSRPCPGAQKVWRVVPGPRGLDEDRRPRHRERAERKAERPQHRKRSKGLLASGGLAVQAVGEDFPTVLEG